MALPFFLRSGRVGIALPGLFGAAEGSEGPADVPSFCCGALHTVK